MIEPDQKSHHNQSAENQWLGVTASNYESRGSTEWHLLRAERETTKVGFYTHGHTLDVKQRHVPTGKAGTV